MIKPFWVRIGMIGIKTRATAKTWLVASIIGSVIFAILAILIFKTLLQMPTLLALFFGLSGALIVSLSSFWYWFCIKWMDKNEGWQQKSDQTE